MENSPPIYRLPNELLMKIIEKLPRTQWPSLELVDPKSGKFRDAVLLAWGSIRTVDMDRDFIYSDLKAVEDENDHNSEMAKGRLRRQIAQKTESILKKLSERSPFITSLIGLSLIREEPTLNTTTVQYLAKFEHLETVEFVYKFFSVRIVNGREFCFLCGIPLVNFIEFLESTRSRGTLNEIHFDQWRIPDDPVIVANFDRLRAAFANDTNDLTRQSLQLESFSMRMIGGNNPFTFFDGVDASRLTKLSLGYTSIDPAVLTTLINRAPRLQHLDFDFLPSCGWFINAPACQGGRLQPNKDLLAALESHQELISLGFDRIWTENGCACHRFEEKFIKMLRTIGPRLVNFVFKSTFLPTDITGEITDIIQHRLPSLKSITLGKRCASNPEQLRGIADGKELEGIEIATLSYDRNYKAALNEVMTTIINKSPRLKRFNGIDYYPDRRVAFELCKLRDLIDLRFNASQLTKENFVAFSHQVFAEKLQVLHLDRIGDGVEPGLIQLVGKATQLRELRVDRNVTDRLLECLAYSCPNLEKFCASWADGITIGGLQLLVDRCPKLRCLEVDNSAHTLKISVKNLKLDRYRKLEVR